MNKNHFFLSYCGNKRQECETIYNNLSLEGITRIVEPFCGTSAISFYISRLHPLKYEYHLNDNNKFLIELYNSARDEEKFKLLIDELEEMRTIYTDVQKYNKLDINTFRGWIYKHRIFNIRPGLFDNCNKCGVNMIQNMLKAPIIHFLRTEKIIFTSISGVEVLNQYKDDDAALVFLDPPYLQVDNDFYQASDANIYEYLFINPIHLFSCKIYLCLELVWIIKLLFTKYEIVEYNKKYNGPKKKQVIHALIKNILI